MTKSLIQIAPKIRGLYRRVAEKFGVDPSYVSRFARGERRYPKIEAYLNHETQRILASVSKPKGKVKNDSLVPNSSRDGNIGTECQRANMEGTPRPVERG